MRDDQLYREFLSGDQSAGDRLMLRYADALTAYLDGILHNAHDAEDLMLECFSVILVDKPKITEGNFRAYLFKVARNKANHLWKLRFRRQEFSPEEELTETIPDEESLPEDRLWIRERNELLRKCLNRIAPQYREALWLFYFMDLRYAQIAEIMRCGTKKVEDMLRNGRARLKQELGKEGITRDDI